MNASQRFYFAPLQPTCVYAQEKAHAEQIKKMYDLFFVVQVLK